MMSEVVSTGFGKAIAERMERGERAAESEFVELYRRRVTALVMGRLHDTVAAEDLTQEILMAVLIAVRNGRLSDPEKLPSFVRGVARNICNKHLRDRLHRLVEARTDARANDPDPEWRYCCREMLTLVSLSLAELSAIDRQILRCSLYEGLTSEDIGRRLGVEAQTIRQRKCRALRRVRSRSLVLAGRPE